MSNSRSLQRGFPHLLEFSFPPLDLSPESRVEPSIFPDRSGIQASQAFIKGETIFREAPYMIFPSGLSSDELTSEVNKLSRWVRRNKFWKAKQVRKRSNKLASIVATNAIAIDVRNGRTNNHSEDEENEEEAEDVGQGQLDDMEAREKYLGMFEYIAKLNHSCVPNCISRWDVDAQEMILVAWRNIDEGEDLTICVHSDDSFLVWSHAPRNRALINDCEFPELDPESRKELGPHSCECTACTAVMAKRHQSEDNLARYRSQLAWNWTAQEFEELGARRERRRVWRLDLDGALEDLREARALLEEEQKWAQIGPIWLQELFLLVSWGNVRGALAAAEESWKWYTISCGKYNADAYFDPIVTRLLEDPESIAGWRKTADSVMPTADKVTVVHRRGRRFRVSRGLKWRRAFKSHVKKRLARRKAAQAVKKTLANQGPKRVRRRPRWSVRWADERDLE